MRGPAKSDDTISAMDKVSRDSLVGGEMRSRDAALAQLFALPYQVSSVSCFMSMTHPGDRKCAGLTDSVCRIP